VARKRGRYRWLSPADRVVMERRLWAGDLPRVIAADFGCSGSTVRRVRADLWLRRGVVDSGFRLGFEERVEIAVWVARGESNAQIARALGRHRSTVGRELGCCRSRGRYRPISAQRRADRLARRPKPARLAASPWLLAAVEAGWLSGGRRSRSLSGCGRSTPMIQGCTSVTRRSISRCMCSRAASCVAS
jgi:hypothetical protein